MIRRIGAIVMVLALTLSMGVATVVADDPVDPVCPDVPEGLDGVALLAGQDMNVGSVFVWNDEENLYVKYVLSNDALDEGWGIYETHLAVAGDLKGIPTNRRGNPVPGHFPYGDDELDGVPEWCVCIPLEDLNVEAGAELFIAAHAVVSRVLPVEGCWETVWQIGEVEAVVDGQLTCYYDEFNYAGDVGDLGYPQFPAFDDPFVIGSSEDSDFPWLSYGTNQGTVKGYASNFDVEWSGELPFGGRVTLSWSPGRSGRETKILTADTGETATWTVIGETVPPGLDSWKTYPREENTMDLGVVEDGTHSLRFQHTTGDGTFWDWVRLEKPCEVWESESAWAAGTRFVSKGNWATYFTYTVQGWQGFDKVEVLSSGGIAGSSKALDVGDRFLLVAEGTYRFANWGEAGIADAKYSLRPPGQWYSYHNEIENTWVCGCDLGGGFQYFLQIWGGDPLAPLPWEGDLDLDDHEYTMEVIGDGNVMQFQIMDNAYGDNSGSLWVTIFKWE